MLTKNSVRNDPIDRWIKGSSFRNFENEFPHSRNIFSLFSPQNLTFKHSLDAKINQEDEEARDSRIEMFKQYDYLKYPRMIDIIEEHVYL